jgi:hypothetical protein
MLNAMILAAALTLDAPIQQAMRDANATALASMGDRSGRLIRAHGDGFYVQWYPDDGADRVTFTKDGLTWSERETRHYSPASAGGTQVRGSQPA